MGGHDRLAFLASSLAPTLKSGLRIRTSSAVRHSLPSYAFPIRRTARHSTRRTATYAPTPASIIPTATAPVSSASSVSPTLSDASVHPSSQSTSPSTAAPDAQSTTILTFQDAIQRLCSYWASNGCIIWHPYNTEVGAGTMNPATFLRVLGPEPWSVAYDEPSIRPDDSRYGQNPNRLQRHTQFQVILKPAPASPQELVVGSYRALGIDTCRNDVRFVEDNWESPALGAWGLGWEVWLNGMEVTQFTYFQQAGGLTLDSVAVEITYGLERIMMALQGKTHFKDIIFAPGITYGDIFTQNEIEMSQYNMDDADVDRNKQMFQIYEEEALALLEKRLPVPAYNYLLKASHTFNILDARGAIGVTERARYFQRMRALSRDVARLWLTRREELEFPLLPTAAGSNVDVAEADSAVAIEWDELAKRKEAADFVFEIGLEELPAGDVGDVIGQVQNLMKRVLKDARLTYSGVEVDGTPRRIVAFVRGLQTRQADQTRRVRGPPFGVALKDGEMTKAAKGFMRSQGVSEEAVEFDEDKGYMFATVETIGRSAVDVLSEALVPELLERINFGKSMRWNDTGVAFSRPVRWLLCLLDDLMVPLSFAGVSTSNFTRSLRGGDGFAREVVVPTASDYHAVMNNEQVVISREARAQYIRDEAVRLAAEVGGTVPEDALHSALLDEVVDLLENPLPLLGHFDDNFLDLPKEVLESVMKKHQRYLPVVDEGTGQLINAFITVANGDASKVDIDAIRIGNEAVLRARYSDAAFFYEKDTKDRTLAEFIPKLSGLTFQESLGSMLDKKNRIKICVGPLCKLFGLPETVRADAEVVADLFKADLMTSMVIEMTSLAGTIGRHYTAKSNEVSKNVSEAIFEANLPRFSGDRVAKSQEGAIIAIADKVDSLVGLFSVGLIPKSTADPFALRRAALGVVQTLVSVGMDVNLSEVVRISANSISNQTGKEITTEVQEAVLDFVSKRLEGYLLENMGFPDDVVKATLGVINNRSNPVAAMAVGNALRDLLVENREAITNAQDVHCRASRLLGSVKDVTIDEMLLVQVDENLFECDEEKVLWGLLQKAVQGDATVANGDTIAQAMITQVEKLVSMRTAVDAFFDGVFVNAEDANVRRNRLGICARIVSITRDLADLSLLVIT